MAIGLIAKRLSILMLVPIVGFSATIGLNNSSAAETNTIRVEAGETLEIGTETLSAQSEFSWILTKDRKFQSAQRNRFFQTRLAEPGTYVLDVSVQDPITSQNGYRAFTLVVIEPTGTAPLVSGDKTKPLSAVLRTDAPTLNGIAYVSPEGGMIKIDPSGSDGAISSYHIDLDTSVDTDGDGNPANDIDNLATLSEKSGTPLYVFMLPKASERRVKLTTTDLGAVEPKTVELPILFAPSPLGTSSAPANADPNSPILFEREGATVRYSANVNSAQSAGTELLYEWDFGDKSKSLLYAPVHSYAVAGTYTVSLVVRNISTAAVVYQGTQTVTIDGLPVTQSSSSTGTVSSTSSSVSSSAASDGGSSVSFKGIFTVSMIILFLLALAVGLYVLFTWIKRKTSTSLQKTLEKMEGNIVNKDTKIDAVTPVPMKLKKEVPKPTETIPEQNKITEREKPKQDVKTQERTAETPAKAAGPVPAWLAKASTKPVTSTTAPSPTLARPVSPAPTPTPAPTSVPLPSPSPAESGPVPAWLKPASAPAPVAAPVPMPTPAPVAAPLPQPKVPEAPKPEPKPEVKVAPTPAPVPTPIAQPKVPEAPKPQPKPEVKTAPALVPVPAPQAPPKVSEAPNPQPKPEVKLAPVSAPASTPTPAPEPKVQEAPKLEPKSETMPVVPTSPKPAPVSQPILPATPAPQTLPIKNDSDPTIAIIQADSISK